MDKVQIYAVAAGCTFATAALVHLLPCISSFVTYVSLGILKDLTYP